MNRSEMPLGKMTQSVVQGFMEMHHYSAENAKKMSMAEYPDIHYLYEALRHTRFIDDVTLDKEHLIDERRIEKLGVSAGITIRYIIDSIDKESGDIPSHINRPMIERNLKLNGALRKMVSYIAYYYLDDADMRTIAEGIPEVDETDILALIRNNLLLKILISTMGARLYTTKLAGVTMDTNDLFTIHEYKASKHNTNVIK